MNKKPKVASEEKQKEALLRMQYLELGEDVINYFATGIIPLCVNGIDGIYGIPKGSVDRITNFEREHNAIVYAVVYVATNIGDMESYFYVSDWEEEWEMDRCDLTEGYSMTWTENLTHPEYSEFGSIGFERTASGGIRRVS